MHVVCLGAGAIGGYFAGRLVESKAAEVTFLVRPARKAQLERDGLRVESPCGSFQVPVTARLPEELRQPADYVLLTCKAYDLDAAIESIRPAVGPQTAIVPLLNGLSHIDRLNQAFGRERVLGGAAYIAITLLPDGLIRHLNDLHGITFGEQEGGISPRVSALKAVFDEAKAVTATASSDVLQTMWEKLVFLSTLASVTTLMRANIGEIARAPGGIAFMLEMLERSAEIARAAGFPMPPAFMERTRSQFTDASSAMAASMLRDLERLGPIEADHIVGFMLDKAREHGVDDTLHRIVYLHLMAYEQRRAAGRF
jgi:2-dehydropantoate 2-reductase